MPAVICDRRVHRCIITLHEAAFVAASDQTLQQMHFRVQGHWIRCIASNASGPGGVQGTELEKAETGLKREAQKHFGNLHCTYL